jgi:hypothetical protein
MEKEDYHIDMSEKIFNNKTIGIACVSSKTKTNNGCAIRGNLIKFIQKRLFIGSIKEECAKLYSICIYLLIKDRLDNINTLIICNDEDFNYVKEYLIFLLEGKQKFRIVNITEFKKQLGKNIKSIADNYARTYRKRALKRHLWNKNKPLNVVEVNYSIIESLWKKLEEIK